MKKFKKLFAIAVALIMGPVLLWVGGREFSNSRKLLREGKVTSGKVVDHSRERGRKGRVKYYLQVEYQSESGQAFRPRLRVERDTYETASQTGTVKIHFLPSDPTICQAGEKAETKFGLLAFGVLVLGFGVFLIVTFKQPVDEQDAAEGIAENVEQLCDSRQEFVPANPREFRHLDLAYYDQTRAALEAKGFAFLADQEDRAFRQRSKLRVMVRVMVSRDGVTAAGIYHFRPGGMLRVLGAKEARVVDLETKLADGTFVCTTNAEAAGALNSPPGVDACHLPAGTPVETIIEAHARRLVEHLTKNPSAQPVRLQSLNEVHRMQAELHKLKTEFRKQTGLTAEELARIGGTTNVQEVAALSAEAERLRQERLRKAA